MKVRELILALQEMPQEYNIEMGRAIAVKGDEEAYDLVLDFPILGLAVSDEVQDVRFVIEYLDASAVHPLGILHKFPDEEEIVHV